MALCGLFIFSILKIVEAGDHHDLNKNIKVTICHVPPGNPENRHEITISLKALEYHLNHGDYIGDCECDEDEESEEDDGGKHLYLSASDKR